MVGVVVFMRRHWPGDIDLVRAYGCDYEETLLHRQRLLRGLVVVSSGRMFSSLPRISSRSLLSACAVLVVVVVVLPTRVGRNARVPEEFESRLNKLTI